QRAPRWPWDHNVPERRRSLAHFESAQFASGSLDDQRQSRNPCPKIKKGAISPRPFVICLKSSDYCFPPPARFTNISSSIGRLPFTCVSRILITDPFSVRFMRKGNIMPSTER